MHHAYYIEDSPSLFDAYLNGIREKQRVDAHSPNWYARRYEKFGIDEARELQGLAQLKKTGERAQFVLGISSITSEAQQSLLKLFEEPQQGLVFIVLLPPGILLPTLRSRMLAYDKLDIHTPSVKAAAQFLSASGKARSAIVSDLLDDDEWAKDNIRDFLNALEVTLQKHLKDAKVRDALQDISRIRSYVNDRSPSLKMLLEHLALSVPTT